MVLLWNYNLWGNVNFTVFLKNLTFIFLTWTFLTYIDMSISSKSLDKKYEHDKILNINFNRSLARHEQQGELRYSNMKEKLSNHNVVGAKINIADQISTNSQLKGKRLNYIDAYMKDYEKRYRKKTGVSKLDCYCEKRVFDKIHGLYGVGEKMQNKKRFKKYIIVLILISLIPALGLIFPILFGVEGLWKGAKDYFCLNNSHSGGGEHSGCNKIGLIDYKGMLESLGEANYVIFPMIGVISMLFFIYILIKVIKYKRLVSGKR